MQRKKINPELQKLIETLRHIAAKEKVALWRRVAADLALGTKKRRIVNISRINHYAQKNQVIVVPGKVLASGELTQPLYIAAFRFSREAKQKIEQANGKAATIFELLEKNPKGKEVRIIG